MEGSPLSVRPQILHTEVRMVTEEKMPAESEVEALAFTAELEALGLNAEQLGQPQVAYPGDGQGTPPISLRSTQDEYYTIYDTETGEPSRPLRYMVPKALTWMNTETGKRRFNIKQLVPWRQGTFLCPLHKDDPDRALYDRIGLASTVCRKHNLVSDATRWAHLRFKHASAYKIIQEHRQREREDRIIALQQAQTDALQALAQRGLSVPPDLTPTSPPSTSTTANTDAAPTWSQRMHEKKAAIKAKRDPILDDHD